MTTDLQLDILSFLSATDARNCSPHTLQQYRRQLAALAAWLEQRGVTQVEAITQTHLTDYLVSLRRRGLKPSSQHAAFRAARVFLRWYERTQAPPPDWRNPIRAVQGPRLPRRRLPPPPIEHLRAIVATCRGRTFADDRDRALIMFLFDTGLRAAECAGLDVGHLDQRSGAVLVLGKGGKTRMAYTDPAVVREIRRYLRHRPDAGPEAPLWTDRHGRRLTYWGLRQIIERRARLAGVPMIPLHGIRRAFATAKHNAGVSSIDLQRLLGHADGQTLWRYVDVDEAHLQELHRRTSPVARYLSG